VEIKFELYSMAFQYPSMIRGDNAKNRKKRKLLESHKNSWRAS
jgi:hypothetical protein